MSEPSNDPIPYRVVYSERVRDALLELGRLAVQRGLGKTLLAAVEELDWRLRIYPQFGDPLRDLALAPAQLWIGVVPPLVVHYSLDEERRLVMVGVPIRPLPHAGLDPVE